MYFKTLRIAKLNVVMLLVQLISLCLSLLAFNPHFWVAAKGEAISLPLPVQSLSTTSDASTRKQTDIALGIIQPQAYFTRAYGKIRLSQELI